VAPAVKGPFLRTALLAVVAASFGAYIYFVESKKPAPTGDDRKPKEKVFSFDQAKAKEVTLQAAGETIKLVKDGEAWVDRLQMAADASAVDGIVHEPRGAGMDERDRRAAEPAGVRPQTPEDGHRGGRGETPRSCS
jgi:hypothetical protein